MWWLMFIPAWLLQNTVHEASHLFFAWRSGRKPLGLYPYPHTHKGRFYFARCAWEKGPPLEPKSMIMAAPVVGVLVVQMLVLGTLTIVPKEQWIWMLPFAICALVDALWWVQGLVIGTPHSDAQRWLHGDLSYRTGPKE